MQEMREINIYIYWVPGRGKAKPTCKAEDRRSTSRIFDWHTFCQRHYFADMSQYWDMSDPHVLGLRHDWSLHWGWEIQSQKTRLSHFWPLKLATFWGDATMLRDIRLTLFVSPHAKGRDAYFLRFQGREGGLTTRKIDSCTFVANDTLRRKGREAYFLGAYAERIANLTYIFFSYGMHNILVTCLLLVTCQEKFNSN